MDDLIEWNQALRAGFSEHDVRTRVAAGDWVPLMRGWYATRAPQDEKDLHLMRLTAVLRANESRLVASHSSAALHWGLPMHDVDLSTVHVTFRKSDRRSKRSTRLHMHACPRRAFEPVDNAEHPAIAILQLASLSFEAGLVAVDEALRRGLVDSEQLHRAESVMGRCRSVESIRQVVSQADGRHESPGETLTAFQLRLAGIEVEPQFVIPGTERWTQSRHGYRADFRVKGERVLIEFDGRSKYGRGVDVWQEKQREDRIRSLDWGFVRPIWRDLLGVGRLASMVREAVAYKRAGYRETPAS